MESLYLQQARDDLKDYLLQCDDAGTELERTPYAITTVLTLRGLPCVGKEIFSSLCQQDPRKFARRLSEECRDLSQLAHPNIAQFMGVHFTPRNTALLVIEHLPQSIGAVLDHNPTLPEPLIYGILTDIILAFRYLHERSKAVVHRDFNANNVLLTLDYRAKISDLGIAKIADVSVSKASRLSKVPGTLCYMAPEVLVSIPKFDASSNIFSYGILVLHLFSGQWPLPTEATVLDPNQQNRLIPVSEWDRRQEYVSTVGSNHPLNSVAKLCLSNNPSLRPKAIDIWKTVTQVNTSKQTTQKERLELIVRLKSSSSSAPPTVSHSVGREAELEPRLNYENQQPIGRSFGGKQISPPQTNSLERGKNLSTILEKEKSSESPENNTECDLDYENQLVMEKLQKSRATMDSGPSEREKPTLPFVPGRGRSSPAIFDKRGSSSVSTERGKQPPPVAEKNRPSSSISSGEKQFPSILEKSKQLFNQKDSKTGNLPGNSAEKETRDSSSISRISSRFSKNIFEEQVEKEKPESDQRRPQVNSNSGDSVSKLTKMFAAKHEPQTSPVLPKTAPKPTKSGRWHSQEEVESQMMKKPSSTVMSRGNKNFEQEDIVDEVYDSYVDMTPKILEEESKVRIFAKVVYDYVADDEDELTITVGETVEVVDIQEHDDQPQWWLVRKGEAFGNIPSTYVTIIQNPQTPQSKPPTPKSTAPPADHTHRGMRMSGSDYPTHQHNTPSFLRNRSPTRTGGITNRQTLGGGGGRSSHRASIFVNLDDFKSRRKTVEALFGPQTSTVTTPTPQPTPTQQQQAVPRPAQVPQPKSYVALYDFTPNNKDEIGFIAGDHVVDAYDLCEGWLQGTIVRTGQRGNVPKTYFRT